MPLMSGIGVLLVLILISSVPAIAVFIWFRLARYPFSPPLFFISLLAGAASLFPALFLQNVLTAANEIFHPSGRWGLFAEIFIRIAFTEELSRLIILIILFAIFNRIKSASWAVIDANAGAASSGLIAGLGFAILESAAYSAANPGYALLRAFTAAPLHGACGSRVGLSVAMFRQSPVRALSRFLSAVIIHGVYNLLLVIPGYLPAIAAILIALLTMATAVVAIRGGMR